MSGVVGLQRAAVNFMCALKYDQTNDTRPTAVRILYDL